MYTESISDYTSTCSALMNKITDCNTKLTVTEQSAKLRESYAEKVQKIEANIKLCNGVIDTVKPMIEDTQTFMAAKRDESLQNINNALRLASEIIPDASDGICFQNDGNESWLSTADGLEVQDVEGGGFRNISSTFLRAVVLAAGAENLQTLFLDEVFAAVSPENANTLSLYLNIMCQDKQVISIEQTPAAYANVDCIYYTFNKGEEFTEVTRSEHIRETDEIGEAANAIQTD